MIAGFSRTWGTKLVVSAKCTPMYFLKKPKRWGFERIRKHMSYSITITATLHLDNTCDFFNTFYRNERVLLKVKLCRDHHALLSPVLYPSTAGIVHFGYKFYITIDKIHGLLKYLHPEAFY